MHDLGLLILDTSQWELFGCRSTGNQLWFYILPVVVYFTKVFTQSCSAVALHSLVRCLKHISECEFCCFDLPYTIGSENFFAGSFCWKWMSAIVK